MSFNVLRRKALNNDIIVNKRLAAVRSCVQLCLFYSGKVGFQKIISHYAITHNQLPNSKIEDIISELTNLRERSKKILLDFQSYRKNQKRNGFIAFSKKEKLLYVETFKKINLLWENVFNWSKISRQPITTALPQVGRTEVISASTRYQSSVNRLDRKLIRR